MTAGSSKIGQLLASGAVTIEQVEAWRERASIVRKEKLNAAEFRAKYPEIDALARPVVAAYARSHYRAKLSEAGGDPSQVARRAPASEGVRVVRRLRRAGFTMVQIEAEAKKPESSRLLVVSPAHIAEWRSFRAAEARETTGRGGGRVQQAILRVLSESDTSLTPGEIHTLLADSEIAYDTVVSTLSILIRGAEALVTRVAPAGPTGRYENAPRYHLTDR